METPSIDPDLDRRLNDWGRWARARKWLSTCMSVEGRYRAPAADVWDREPRALPVDAKDAWLVECTWRKLPLRERLILRAYYVQRSNQWETHIRRTCRSLGLPIRDWATRVSNACRMIDNLVHASDNRAIIYTHRSGENASTKAADRAAFSFVDAV